jgi:hypothetical protein
LTGVTQELVEANVDPVENPYVGPRTFTNKERHLFFGRDAEAEDLHSLVISQRLVLFYAQSGAGKSSLVNTRLIPGLQNADFVVLPVGRVGGVQSSQVASVRNIFLYNLMLSLDQQNVHSDRLATLPLAEFLERLTSADGQSWFYDESDEGQVVDASLAPVAQNATSPFSLGMPPSYVLIIDQFEEIFNTYLERWHERTAFFEELEAAMQADPSLWVVLVFREDYLASLDPYAPLMTEKMRARYYMERMTAEAAYDAIQRPAEAGNRLYQPGVIEQLIDNLRQIPAPGQGHSQTGQYIEPLQLQVVCYQLWKSLNAKDQANTQANGTAGIEEASSEKSKAGEAKLRQSTPITLADLEEFGNVDRALADFYTEAISVALSEEKGQVSEFFLRNWFSSELITEAGTRGLIFRGESETQGLPNEIVTALTKSYLLRAELRAGGIWIELVHDRFIAPILQANQEWILHQSPLLRAVQAWLDSKRDAALLVKGGLLQAAKRETSPNRTAALLEPQRKYGAQPT